MMIAGLRQLISGDNSLHGLASLLEAVLEPPGLWIVCMRLLFSEDTWGLVGVELCTGGGMNRLSPVALVDLTMEQGAGGLSLLTRGLGISGQCCLLRPRLVTGREVGPLTAKSLRPAWRAKASASSRLMLNLGSWSDLVCRCLLRCL